MRRPVLLLAAVLFALPAQAAPVATDWTLDFDGIWPAVVPIAFAGSGSVSVVGSTIQVPAGAIEITTAHTFVDLTGAGTLIKSVVVTKLSNLSATFSLGGVTNQAPSEVCVPTPPASSACNAGGGIGGSMALTGTLFLHIVPDIVVLPLNLGAMRLGAGGPATGNFTTEPALWSTGLAIVNTGNNTHTGAGGTSPFRLVTPTFISTLGNVLPIITTLTLTNVAVPEPNTLVLLVAGATGAFGALRWRATRRRR